MLRHVRSRYLATSGNKTLTRVCEIFALRMEVEEGFRDLKSHRYGAALRYVEFSAPDRYQRLLLIWAIRVLRDAGGSRGVRAPRADDGATCRRGGREGCRIHRRRCEAGAGSVRAGVRPLRREGGGSAGLVSRGRTPVGGGARVLRRDQRPRDAVGEGARGELYDGAVQKATCAIKAMAEDGGVAPKGTHELDRRVVMGRVRRRGHPAPADVGAQRPLGLLLGAWSSGCIAPG
jgi:hypothetical protein